MSWCSVLAVANVTADSDELLGALRERTKQGRVRVQLVVPIGGAGPDREAGERQLERGMGRGGGGGGGGPGAGAGQPATPSDRIAEAGIEVQGQVVRGDPVQAVHEVWDPTTYDEIVVTTLPTGVSKWLRIDVPHRPAAAERR